jgi:hypothetical protein
MNRARILLAVLLMVGAVATVESASPDGVVACSCFRPDSVEELLRAVAREHDPGTVVLAGRIVRLARNLNGRQTGALVVTHVFKGAVPRQEVPIIGGGGGDCTVDLEGLSDVVMVARVEWRSVVPGLCRPIAALATAEGQELFNTAVEVFGVGPPAEEDLPSVPGADVALLATLGILVAVAGSLFLLVARRKANP